MTALIDITTEDLQAELARRKETEKTQRIPVPKVDINFIPLVGCCQDYIIELAKQGYADDDFPHYIYEAALTAIYGDDVWTFINKARIQG
jgi:hypothetical protein